MQAWNRAASRKSPHRSERPGYALAESSVALRAFHIPDLKPSAIPANCTLLTGVFLAPFKELRLGFPKRYGAPAVAGHVAAQLGLAHSFIDIDNPA